MSVEFLGYVIKTKLKRGVESFHKDGRFEVTIETKEAPKTGRVFKLVQVDTKDYFTPQKRPPLRNRR